MNPLHPPYNPLVPVPVPHQQSSYNVNPNYPLSMATYYQLPDHCRPSLPQFSVPTSLSGVGAPGYQPSTHARSPYAVTSPPTSNFNFPGAALASHFTVGQPNLNNNFAAVPGAYPVAPTQSDPILRQDKGLRAPLYQPSTYLRPQYAVTSPPASNLNMTKAPGGYPMPSLQSDSKLQQGKETSLDNGYNRQRRLSEVICAKSESPLPECPRPLSAPSSSPQRPTSNSVIMQPSCMMPLQNVSQRDISVEEKFKTKASQYGIEISNKARILLKTQNSEDEEPLEKLKIENKESIEEEMKKLKAEMFEKKAKECGIVIQNSQTVHKNQINNNKNKILNLVDSIPNSHSSSVVSSVDSTSENNTDSEECGIQRSLLVDVLNRVHKSNRSVSESSSGSILSEFEERPPEVKEHAGSLGDIIDKLVTQAIEDAISECLNKTEDSKNDKERSSNCDSVLTSSVTKISTLNPSSPEFRPNMQKNEKVIKPFSTTSLDPSSPEFIPSVYNKTEMAIKPHSTAPLNPSSPEFKPSGDLCSIATVPSKELCGKSLLSHKAPTFEPSIHIKPYSRSVGVSKSSSSQTDLRETQEVGSNTRRVKQLDKSVFTGSCDSRDICVNTVESLMVEESDRVIDIVRKKDQGVMTRKVKTKSAAVMVTPEDVDPSKNSPKCVDFNLKERLLQTQRELLVLRGKVCLDELNRNITHLQENKEKWNNLFSPFSSIESVESVINSRINNLKMDIFIVQHKLKYCEDILMAGELLEPDVPRFTIPLPVGPTDVKVFNKVNDDPVSSNHKISQGGSDNGKVSLECLPTLSKMPEGNKRTEMKGENMVMDDSALVNRRLIGETDGLIRKEEKVKEFDNAVTDDMVVEHADFGAPLPTTCAQIIDSNDKLFYSLDTSNTAPATTHSPNVSELTLNNKSKAMKIPTSFSAEEEANTSLGFDPTTFEETMTTASEEDLPRLLNSSKLLSESVQSVDSMSSRRVRINDNGLDATVSCDIPNPVQVSLCDESNQNKEVIPKIAPSVAVPETEEINIATKKTDSNVISQDSLEVKDETSQSCSQSSLGVQGEFPQSHEISNSGMASQQNAVAVQGSEGSSQSDSVQQQSAVDPLLYNSVVNELKKAYPHLTANPIMLSSVAMQQTMVLQMFMANNAGGNSQLVADVSHPSVEQCTSCNKSKKDASCMCSDTDKLKQDEVSAEMEINKKTFKVEEPFITSEEITSHKCDKSAEQSDTHSMQTVEASIKHPPGFSESTEGFVSLESSSNSHDFSNISMKSERKTILESFPLPCKPLGSPEKLQNTKDNTILPVASRTVEDNVMRNGIDSVKTNNLGFNTSHGVSASDTTNTILPVASRTVEDNVLRNGIDSKTKNLGFNTSHGVSASDTTNIGKFHEQNVDKLHTDSIVAIGRSMKQPLLPDPLYSSKVPLLPKPEKDISQLQNLEWPRNKKSMMVGNESSSEKGATSQKQTNWSSGDNMSSVHTYAGSLNNQRETSIRGKTLKNFNSSNDMVPKPDCTEKIAKSADSGKHVWGNSVSMEFEVSGGKEIVCQNAGHVTESSFNNACASNMSSMGFYKKHSKHLHTDYVHKEHALSVHNTNEDMHVYRQNVQPQMHGAKNMARDSVERWLMAVPSNTNDAVPESEDPWMDRKKVLAIDPFVPKWMRSERLPTPQPETLKRLGISCNALDNSSEDKLGKEKENAEENGMVEDDWTQVTKKGKKMKLENLPGNQPPSANARKPVTSAAEKDRKINNFERLISKLQEVPRFATYSRESIIEIITTVRTERGGLSGMTITDIVSAALLVTSRTGVNQAMKSQQQPHYRSGSQDTRLHRSSLPLLPAPSSFLPSEQVPDEEICVICHDGLSTGTTKLLECGHVYHTNCINQWVYGREMTCPTCRRLVLFPEEFPKLGK